MKKDSGYGDEELKERWRKKSSSYPRYSDNSQSIESYIFGAMKDAGIDFRDKTLLDIGCGTGIYTIRAAKEAKSVTGVDISEEMLRILAEDAKASGCGNIGIVQSSWDDFDSKCRKWDIVMSTMTPAVRTPKDYEKAASCAAESVIYLGWGGNREPEMLMDIIRRHNGKAEFFNNSSVMRQWLTSQNIKFFSKTFDEVREKSMTREQALEYAPDTLLSFGIKADTAEIYEAIDKFSDNVGKVVFDISSRFELIIWHKHN